MAVMFSRRRSLEAAPANMSITGPADSRAVIARAKEAFGLADGTVAAMAVPCDLSAVLESPRSLADREAGEVAAK